MAESFNDYLDRTYAKDPAAPEAPLPAPVQPSGSLPKPAAPESFDAYLDRTYTARKAPKPEPVKTGTNFFGGVGVVAEAIVNTPENVIAAGINAVQGAQNVDVADPNVFDRFVADVDKGNLEFQQRVAREHGEEEILPGAFDLTTLAEAPGSLGFSLASLTGGLTGAGVGAAIGTAVAPGPGTAVGAGVGEVVGGAVGALTGSGSVAKRASSAQIMRSFLEAKQEEKGSALTPEEQETMRSEFSDIANEFGLWEAIPEAIGNIPLMGAALRPLEKLVGGKLLKTFATKLGAGTAGVVGKTAGQVVEGAVELGGRATGAVVPELLTEAVTEVGQSRTLAGTVVGEDVPLEWTPQGFTEALRRVAPQTLLLVGSTTAGGAAFRKTKEVITHKAQAKKVLPKIDKQFSPRVTPTGLIEITVGGKSFKYPPKMAFIQAKIANKVALNKEDTANVEKYKTEVEKEVITLTEVVSNEELDPQVRTSAEVALNEANNTLASISEPGVSEPTGEVPISSEETAAVRGEEIAALTAQIDQAKQDLVAGTGSASVIRKDITAKTEELELMQVEVLADKIAAGEQATTPEELQLAANRPKELEAALADRQAQAPQTPITNLNRAVKDHLKNSPEGLTFDATQAEAPEGLEDFVNVVNSKFGKKVVFYKLAEGSWAPEGIASGADPDVTFINVDQVADPHLFTIGHELLHLIKTDTGKIAPNLYKNLLIEAQKVIHTEDFADKKERLREAFKDEGKKFTEKSLTDEANEEVVADVLGEMFLDPQFWGQLMTENPGLFEQLMAKLMQIINRFGNQLPAELKPLRETMATALKEYATLRETQVATEQEFGVGDLRASRPDTDKKIAILRAFDKIRSDLLTAETVVPTEIEVQNGDTGTDTQVSIEEVQTSGERSKRVFESAGFGNEADELATTALELAEKFTSDKSVTSQKLNSAYIQALNKFVKDTPDGLGMLNDILDELRAMGHDIPQSGPETAATFMQALATEQVAYESVRSEEIRASRPDGARFFTDEALETVERQANIPASRSTLIYLSPDQFLDMAAPGIDREKTTRIETALDEGKLDSVPSLSFEHDGQGTAKVDGHEGRHRMRALKKRGVELVPVEFLSKEGGEGKGIRWGNQDREFDRVENPPTVLQAEKGSGAMDFPNSVVYPLPEAAKEEAPDTQAVLAALEQETTTDELIALLQEAGVKFKRETTQKADNKTVKTLKKNLGTLKGIFRKGQTLSEKFAEFLPTLLKGMTLPHKIEVYKSRMPWLEKLGVHVDKFTSLKNGLVTKSQKLYNSMLDAVAGDSKAWDDVNLMAATATLYQVDPRKAVEKEWTQEQWDDAKMEDVTGHATPEAAHREARSLYMKVPKPMRKIYDEIIDDVKSLRARERKNMLRRILEMEKTAPGEAVRLRDAYDMAYNNLKGAYLPLSRFGAWSVSIKDSETGDVLYSANFDTIEEANQLVDSFGEDTEGLLIQRQYTEDTEGKDSNGINPAQAAEIAKAAELRFPEPTAAMTEEEADELTANKAAFIEDLTAMWARNLPEMSAIKNSLQRKGTAGFDADMMRGYINYVLAHSSSIAYAEEGQVIDNMFVEEAQKLKDSDQDVLIEQMVLRDIQAHLVGARKTTRGKLAQVLGKMTLAWYLSSPSQFMLQLSQLGVMTLPKIAARYGAKRATAALSTATQKAMTPRAYNPGAVHAIAPFWERLNETYSEEEYNAARELAIKETRDIEATPDFIIGDPKFSKEQQLEMIDNILDETSKDTLPPQVVAHMRKISTPKRTKEKMYLQDLLVLKMAETRNLLDMTLSHTALEVAGGNEHAGIANKMAFFIRESELISRKAATLAAHQIAMKGDSKNAPRDFLSSFDYAAFVNKDTLFDYSTEAKPPILRDNDIVSTMAHFQTFRISTAFKLIRLAQLSFSNTADPIKKAEARKEITGILAVTAVLSGVTGLPLVGTILALVQLAAEDDDEPVVIELELRQAIAALVGETSAEAIMGGVPKIFGIDLSRRVGMDSVFGPSYEVPAWMEGDEALNYQMQQMLGPAWSVFTDVARGTEFIGDGKYLKGMETLSPKLLRDGLKAFRVASEGYKDGRGMRMLEDGALGPAEITLMAVGITPLQVSSAQRAKRELGEISVKISNRKGDLVRQFGQAHENEDIVAREEILRQIGEFNRKNPESAIATSALAGAIKKSIYNDRAIQSVRDLLLTRRFDINVFREEGQR